MRARIVLGCADGKENRQVARELRITDQTVCKWRERFRKMAWKDRPTNPDLVHRVRFPTLRSKL
jgi:transposase